MSTSDPRALLEACLQQNGELHMAAVGASMWPELRAGDELRLTHVAYSQITPGDIVLVHHMAQREPGAGYQPVLLAHRVLKTYIESGRAMLVTKGDRKALADPPVFYEQVVGRVEEARRAGQLVYVRDLQRYAKAKAWGGRVQDAVLTWALERLLGNQAPTDEAQALCQLVAYSMDWTPYPVLPDVIDWEALYQIASSGRFTPLLSHKAIPGAPEWFVLRCLDDLRENQAHRLLIDQQLEAVLGAFGLAEIPVLLVKGPAHAEMLYPNPYWRPMVDLDLVVAPVDWEASIHLLEGLGFIQENTEWSRLTEQLTGQIALLKPVGPFCVAIELHRDLKMLSERLAVRGEVNMQRAWHDAVTIPVGDACVVTLAPEDALAYASTHWAQHHFFNSIWLLDIALMASKPGLDWQKLVDDAHADGTASFVWTTLSLARDLFAAPVPQAALRALAPQGIRATLISHLAFSRAASCYKEDPDVRSLLLQLLMVKRWRDAFSGLWAGVFPSSGWLAQHYVAAGGEKSPGRFPLLVRHWGNLARLLRVK